MIKILIVVLFLCLFSPQSWAGLKVSKIAERDGDFITLVFHVWPKFFPGFKAHVYASPDGPQEGAILLHRYKQKPEYHGRSGPYHIFHVYLSKVKDWKGLYDFKLGVYVKNTSEEYESIKTPLSRYNKGPSERFSVSKIIYELK